MPLPGVPLNARRVHTQQNLEITHQHDGGDQSVDRQGLDEGATDNHGRLNLSRGFGLTSHGFHGRADCASQTQARADRGQTKTDLRSEALVELVDIAPTLLDAAGIDVPAAMQGRSLWPLLTGEAEPTQHKDHVISEFNDALGSATGEGPSHGSMYFS